MVESDVAVVVVVVSGSEGGGGGGGSCSGVCGNDGDDVFDDEG